MFKKIVDKYLKYKEAKKVKTKETNFSSRINELLDEKLKKMSNANLSANNKIIVDGVEYDVRGKNIIVDKNNNVFVDCDYVVGPLFGNIKIEFVGNIANLSCTSATIHGNVLGDVDCTSLKCDDVGGDVDSTTINCRDIKGNVDSTTIKCNSYSGSRK